VLPFLKQKPQASGVVTQVRAPDQPEENSMTDLESAAEDILRSINMKDVKGLAQALKAAYDMCESTEESSEDEYTNEDESLTE